MLELRMLVGVELGVRIMSRTGDGRAVGVRVGIRMMSCEVGRWMAHGGGIRVGVPELVGEED